MGCARDAQAQKHGAERGPEQFQIREGRLRNPDSAPRADRVAVSAASAAAAQASRAPARSRPARTTHSIGSRCASQVATCTLTTVIAKPMQFTMVSAEPTNSLGAVAALSAENCGESPTTTMPQKTMNARKAGAGSSNAQRRQQAARARTATTGANATRALPTKREQRAAADAADRAGGDDDEAPVRDVDRPARASHRSRTAGPARRPTACRAPTCARSSRRPRPGTPAPRKARTTAPGSKRAAWPGAGPRAPARTSARRRPPPAATASIDDRLPRQAAAQARGPGAAAPCPARALRPGNRARRPGPGGTSSPRSSCRPGRCRRGRSR